MQISCKSCGHVFESPVPYTFCPKCGGDCSAYFNPSAANENEGISKRKEESLEKIREHLSENEGSENKSEDPKAKSVTLSHILITADYNSASDNLNTWMKDMRDARGDNFKIISHSYDPIAKQFSVIYLIKG